MFSHENENWAVHAAVHNNVEKMRSSMRSSRSLTRSKIITTMATTRNNSNNCQVAKEATATIDNGANKVAKRNHFNNSHNEKL